MRAYDVLRRVVRLIGSAWGFFPVAVVALYAHGIYGDPFGALPFLLEWALVVGACRWLARLLPAGRQPVLRTNRSLPPPALVISIAPVMPPERSPDVEAMKARLPANVARLLR